jgi:hypothetical protein
MNRKDFFRYGGRFAILAGLGMLSGFLAYNQKIVTPENCSVTPQCKTCGKYAQCELIQKDKDRKDGK